MKKQFNVLKDWKEKVRGSNQANLRKFEELKQKISEQARENEYLRQQMLPKEAQVRPGPKVINNFHA